MFGTRFMILVSDTRTMSTYQWYDCYKYVDKYATVKHRKGLSKAILKSHPLLYKNLTTLIIHTGLDFVVDLMQRLPRNPIKANGILGILIAYNTLSDGLLYAIVDSAKKDKLYSFSIIGGAIFGSFEESRLIRDYKNGRLSVGRIIRDTSKVLKLIDSTQTFKRSCSLTNFVEEFNATVAPSVGGEVSVVINENNELLFLLPFIGDIPSIRDNAYNLSCGTNYSHTKFKIDSV